MEADRSHKTIHRQRGVGEELREPAGGDPEGELELKAPFARRDPALREPEIVEVGRRDVGDAPFVPEDLDAFPEPRHGSLALDRRERAARDLTEPFERVVHRAAG
jgi:hypothetical protein